MSDTTAARALAEAATHGPWEVVADRVMAADPVHAYGATLTEVIADEVVDDLNAEFIAAARTLVPELCDEVERLRAVVARVEDLAGQWPCSDETCDGECTGCAYGRDLREALRGEP